jgi:acetyltransferase-like isoleucine patch superfamily enzyme
MAATSARTLPWDWYGGTLPGNAEIDPTAYIETTFSFLDYRSTMPVGFSLGYGASTYKSTMYDVGPRGVVRVGKYSLVHGARIICDESIEIGDHVLISWNVLLMDTYRAPTESIARRDVLLRAGANHSLQEEAPTRPVRVGNNVWLGFDACVLPGVTIGDGCVVGARSVVYDDLPAYTVAGGNPARVIRTLDASGVGVHLSGGSSR